MSRSRGVIALLSIGWIATVPALLWFGFWDSYSVDGTPSLHARRGAWLMLTAVALGVLLPMAITVVAVRARRFVMAGIFFVLTALLAVPAVGIVVEAVRQLRAVRDQIS